jgi:asparagine synthase (glutamine-hydrolysing)
MCGIFSLLNINNQCSIEFIKDCFNKSKCRGPETSSWKTFDSHKIMLGFHRLAINGLTSDSDQPIITNNCILICNGEIYNYKELYQKHPDIIAKTGSDCEIIIHMYKKYGIDYTLNNLDGVFAFILYDLFNDILFVSRDPYGVRPLYHLYNNNELLPYIGFASELKQLSDIKQKLESISTIYKSSYELLQFEPGTYMELHFKIDNWNIYNIQYYTNMGFYTMSDDYNYDNILHMIKTKFINAVQKRVVGTTDRPVACLLSGGLDSSLVTSIVNSMVPNLETYSIGLAGSEDLKYAQIVADFLGTTHHSIIVSEDDFFNAIPEVIYKVESYDTTTIRASVGNYLIAKYISKHSEAKVIFNGDGSDELMGGYLYFHSAPNEFEFDKECQRLLKNIHLFDGLRSDRSISSNGLEPRTPFLDRGWVEFFLSLPKTLRFHPINHKCEKYLIREAFSKKTSLYKHSYLPDEILFRTKEAFSDGVSSLQRSWYQIIDEKVKTILPDNTDHLFNKYKYQHNPPTTLEQLYYRTIFDSYYINCATVIPYFWMPRFVQAYDSSARTLSNYSK